MYTMKRVKFGVTVTINEAQTNKKKSTQKNHIELEKNTWSQQINIKDALPVYFRSIVFTSYILTIFKQ